MNILVLNAGSSSQKICLYQIDLSPSLSEPSPPLWSAQIAWDERSHSAALQVRTASGEQLTQTQAADSPAAATTAALATLWSGSTQAIATPQAIDIVGHRVVHGGEKYRQSTWIDADVRAEIDRLSIFAPLHNPANLAGIETIDRLLGTGVPQVAAFDTAFFSQLPPAAYIYPLPYELLERGIRRYGFHGISHYYCAHRSARLLDRDLSSLRLITCHLGNGCSLAATLGGRAIDTTMGFTPLEGLMMGTRSGSIDPGILLHLLRHLGFDADKLERMLDRESGLLGVSGVSNDLWQVVAAMEQGNERARLAYDIFIHRLRSGIGAMLASLGGVDAVVFTGGIGENSARVRAAASEAFAFIGLELDDDCNQTATADLDLTSATATVKAVVVHTEEDWAIACDCYQMAVDRHMIF